MLFLRFLLFLMAFGALAGAVGMVVYDVFLAFELDRLLRRREPAAEAAQPGEATASGTVGAVGAGTGAGITSRAALPRRPRRVVLGDGRWKRAVKLVVIAAALALAGTSIVVVPDGEAAVRISQLYGVLPGTLCPGTHFVWPLVDRVQLYDIRDRVFQTASGVVPRERFELLTVESREGLSIGIGVAVRYRVDPKRLDYIQANLPQPIEDEIVEPVVTAALRELAPNYVVRDVFSTKREEFRELAAKKITARLAEDGIDVKEVLLRKIQLPQEYAQGLEGLLLKEQEDDQTSVEAEIEQKRVKIAEARAEAAKVQEVKRAEGDAQARVIQAKAEADAMQYTLPLKQKQIEQSRLEAEARKAATIQNAEAEAQAKVIDSKAEQQRQGLLADAAAQAKIVDSKAEQQRRNLLADAEANEIRVTAQAHAEELQLEAAALKSNPLLVQYTVAQKLSDKVQIMLVPSDGKFFFTNDVLQSMAGQNVIDPPARPGSRP
ncbi:MAG TPA: SPFH domain-containing protein [Candidatus Acidoferrum sp.]|nr:SPFH domain-containing protein [Candidatus Acidoferrum sp.]